MLQSAPPLPDGSRAAVAGSTMAMAALLDPLRARIQRLVDRRFYRSRHDAIKAVEGPRDEPSPPDRLEGHTEELITVVQRTVQPSHVSMRTTSASAQP